MLTLYRKQCNLPVKTDAIVADNDSLIHVQKTTHPAAIRKRNSNVALRL